MSENKESPNLSEQFIDNQIVLARTLLPETIPLIALRSRPLFPKMVVPILVDDVYSKKVIDFVTQNSLKYIGLVLIRSAQKPEQSSQITSQDFYKIGVVAEVLKINQATIDAPMHMMVGAIDRFSIEYFVSEEPIFIAKVKYMYDTEMTVNEELKAYSISVINIIKELLKLNPLFKEELSFFLTRVNLNDPGRLADFAAAMTSANADELQDILETLSIRQRIEKTLVLLKKELDIAKLQVKINQQIEEKLSKQQREFFLREQLKAIKKELGLVKEGKETEIEEFKKRVENLNLSDEAKERFEEELSKLSLLEPSSPEFIVSRNYLDWLTSLPWGIFTKDRYDIKEAKAILDRDHYGLDDVKERILEFIAVGKMKNSISGSILCFVGPPGVGKTSVGKSIASSLGRKFYRFSVGGMRDEAEIKGHRRTYIGALPGKFIQAMRFCKSANPVIMLDEIDKIGMGGFQGDPASALLETLDPEQNREFLDHYLDVRFDLSNVLFICTANIVDTIPRPLLDRMEIIKLAGYITEEKIKIAKKFLIPKQLKEVGLNQNQVIIEDNVLRKIIDGYAREPGVRTLENQIKKIFRKASYQIVSKKVESILVNSENLTDFLGKPIFKEDDLLKKPRVGVVPGLAWTSMGGEVLYIEAIKVEAPKAGFKQTGQLGNVMVESSEIAYSTIRALLWDTKEARKIFNKCFIHIHVPSGATPKDGPSAGITMAMALYSLVLNKLIKPSLAMTGELTLSGIVMPVGGIKEKIIAAKRAGFKNVILPEMNRSDFEDLPSYIRKGLKVFYVSKIEDVIKICFE